MNRKAGPPRTPARPLDTTALNKSTAAAVRARSLLATATSVEIGVLNETVTIHRHAVDSDGALLFRAPADAPTYFATLWSRLPGPTLDATAVDLGGPPRPDRVRGRLHLRGPVRVAPGPLPDGLAAFLGAAPDGVLLLEPQQVILDWPVESLGVVRVPRKEYAAARLDALAGWESEWLTHLHRHHPRLVAALATELGAGAGAHPVLADADGLVLRTQGPAPARPGAPAWRDLRVRFDRPVQCGCDAVAALAELSRRLLGDDDHAGCAPPC